MKTSLIFFTAATTVPFLMLLGLSGVGAFSIMTALSIVAMIGLDYDHSHRLSYVVEMGVPTRAKRVAKAKSETHPLAA